MSYTWLKKADNLFAKALPVLVVAGFLWVALTTADPVHAIASWAMTAALVGIVLGFIALLVLAIIN